MTAPSDAIGEPLILTLRISDREAAYFNNLRRTHFPVARNFIDAHLTIFHHLPVTERAAIDLSLVVATQMAPLRYQVTGLLLLGGGVAFAVASQELEALRTQLVSRYTTWLIPQDRKGFRPHITIQNKVASASARALYTELTAGFVPFEAMSSGLDLSSYLRGPWRHERFFPFIGEAGVEA